MKRLAKKKLALGAEQIRILDLEAVVGGRPKCTENDSTCSGALPTTRPVTVGCATVAGCTTR
jgi:hypothetical protein